MELIGLIVGILGLGGTMVGAYLGWWAPIVARIRERLREAEHTLYFTVVPYGGPGGQGIGVNLQNRSNATAYQLCLYLPVIEGPAWRAAELPAGATHLIQTPLSNDAPARTRQTEGLIARLVYHDRFENRFVAQLALIQQPRADGFYNIVAAPQGPALTRPRIRFRDLWRLRTRV